MLQRSDSAGASTPSTVSFAPAMHEPGSARYHGNRTSTAVRGPSVVSVPCSMMRSGITMTSSFWADAVGRTSLSLFLHSNV